MPSYLEPTATERAAWAARCWRLHLAATRRRRTLRGRILAATGEDPFRALAELRKPRRELGGLTPDEAASIGGMLYRRTLRLCPDAGRGPE